MKIKDIEELRIATEKNLYTPHELSPFQIKLLDNQLFSPRSTMWNLGGCLKFGPGADPLALKTAFEKVATYHPVLNTRMYMGFHGITMQQICPGFASSPSIFRVEEREMPDILAQYPRPFSIFNSPLFRCDIYVTCEHVYAILEFHHIIADGSTSLLIPQDLFDAYLNPDKEWEPDYFLGRAILELAYRSTPEYAAEKAFYEETYVGVKWSNIPAIDFDTTENTAGEASIKLGVSLEKLSKAEKRLRTTRSRLANAAGLLTIAKYNGTSDVLMTWIFDNRVGKGSNRMAGLLITELPIAAHLDQLSTLEDLMLTINLQMKATMKNVSYSYVVDHEGTFANDSMEVNYQGAARSADRITQALISQYSDLDVEIISLMDSKEAEARMELDIREYPEAAPEEQLGLVMIYMASLYKPESIQRILDIYRSIFQRLARAEKTTLLTELLA